MEQRLFVLLLFTGVPLILSVSNRYYLSQQEKNWNDAQAYCRSKSMDLAIIRNNEDMVQLQNKAQTQQFSSSAWIGLSIEANNWLWSMGNEPLGSMRLWRFQQPDNWQGQEGCGALYGAEWTDRPCTDQIPFFCFDNNKTGNQRYIYISSTKTWSAAQAYCRTYHTDLAISRDASENAVIAGLHSGLSWFGLYREPWKWIDKSNFSTLSWISGQPDNSRSNETCGYINNGQVADALCSDIMPFFCYSVPTVIQMMRVKVRSSQDVNDLAIKAAMLEQIKQKIKDLGIAEYVTSKWKEQPDGKVFYKEKENTGTETRDPICVLN